MKFLVTFLAASFILGTLGYDTTVTKYSVGSDVVIASLRRVQDTCIFNNDMLFMRRVAAMETTDGNDLKYIWSSDKGQGGIWQTSEIGLSKTQASTSYAITTRTAIQNQIGVNISNLIRKAGDLDVPLNAAAVARMSVSFLEQSSSAGLIPVDLEGQANYWDKFYRSQDDDRNATDFINLANNLQKCKPPGMDLIFIVDSSGSIGNSDFMNARSFMVTVIQGLQASNQVNRVGIIRFSDAAKVFLTLTSDLNLAINVSKTLAYDAGNTNIADGLNSAYKMFDTYGRIEVPMVAVLLTDGVQNMGGDPTPYAKNLKSLGVNIFGVGVGSAATQDIKKWVSTPNCMFYYFLSGFTQLATAFPELLNAQICDVSAVAPDNQTALAGSVDNGQYLYYQVAANTSLGITLKLNIGAGAAIIYASLTTRLPSGADYAFIANATTTKLGQFYISPSTLLAYNNFTSSGDVIVYTSVYGTKDSTNFTLHYEPKNTVVPDAPVSTLLMTTPTTTPTTPTPTTQSNSGLKNIPTIMGLILMSIVYSYLAL